MPSDKKVIVIEPRELTEALCAHFGVTENYTTFQIDVNGGWAVGSGPIYIGNGDLLVDLEAIPKFLARR